MRRREKLFWLCIGAALIVLFLSIIPGYYKICEIAEKTKEENCSAYRVLPFLVVKIGKILDDHNGAVTAVFTVVLAISTIGLWAATRRLWIAGERQFRHARASALAQSRQTEVSIDVAERTLIAGERAWIRIDARNNGGLIFDDNGNARIQLVFTLTNTGNSPATKVRIHTHIFLANIANFAESTPRDEYRNVCGAIRMRGEMPIEEMLSYTLFPGETKELPYFVMINAPQLKELMDAWKKRTGEDWKFFSPHILGCVSYSIPFDNRQHQTGFMYELKRKLAGQSLSLGWGMFNTDERVVDANDIRLFHSVWGSPHID